MRKTTRRSLLAGATIPLRDLTSPPSFISNGGNIGLVLKDCGALDLREVKGDSVGVLVTGDDSVEIDGFVADGIVTAIEASDNATVVARRIKHQP